MLSDGEFVIPADVVDHLGNGNSDAGAKVLEEMMDEVRVARTGTKKQALEIDPEDFLQRRRILWLVPLGDIELTDPNVGNFTGVSLTCHRTLVVCNRNVG